jgi:hypothetical protein
MRSGGSITIQNGTVIASSEYGGAGIGGGYLASGGTIHILNGDITATGGMWGAGIGSGGPTNAGNITISGGVVKANGGDYGAGIGAGGTNAANTHNGGTIKIFGGKATARGGSSGIDAGLDIGRGRERQVGAVGLEHGQQGDDHLAGALGADPHDAIRAHAAGLEAAGEPVGAAVELAVGQVGVVAAEGDGVGAELLGMVAAFLEPVTVDEETLAFSAMQEVGPGGHFFGAEHTQSRYRTAFHKPMLSDWRNYETWEEAGSPELPSKANRIWKELLAAYEPPPMDLAVLEELDAFVARRVAEGGVPTDY